MDAPHPDLALSLFLPWPQTGSRALLASKPPCLFLLSLRPAWTTAPPGGPRVGQPSASIVGRTQKGLFSHVSYPSMPPSAWCVPSFLCPSHLSVPCLFLTPTSPSAQGLCTQFHLQGFSAAGVCRGPRNISLPTDTAPTSEGPTPAQLKLCGLWRHLGMPAGAGTTPLGSLGLRACGDTIPGPWQDHSLPAVCAATRSGAPHLP